MENTKKQKAYGIAAAVLFALSGIIGLISGIITHGDLLSLVYTIIETVIFFGFAAICFFRKPKLALPAEGAYAVYKIVIIIVGVVKIGSSISVWNILHYILDVLAAAALVVIVIFGLKKHKAIKKYGFSAERQY